MTRVWVILHPMQRLEPWIAKHMTPELAFTRKIVTEGTQPIILAEALCILARENERLLLEAVRDCRAEGRSWAEIGDALGTSRQAARRRFMHVDKSET